MKQEHIEANLKAYGELMSATGQNSFLEQNEYLESDNDNDDDHDQQTNTQGKHQIRHTPAYIEVLGRNTNSDSSNMNDDHTDNMKRFTYDLNFALAVTSSEKCAEDTSKKDAKSQNSTKPQYQSQNNKPQNSQMPNNELNKIREEMQRLKDEKYATIT